jgi:HAD superfamily hydrolase (TIGR01490 family)
MPPPDALIADVLAGPSGPRVGAFFDFDGTVIDGYSAMAIYKHRMRHMEIGPEEFARTLLFGLRGGLDEESFAEVVSLGLKAWTGRSEDELDELGERLLVQDIASSLYPEAWALVQAHRRKGHTVVLASSATRFQIEPLARELGVEHVLSTPAEAEDGILTGRLGGDVLWGAGKARAVRAFAAEHGVDLARSYAYSNGDEDVPFLETVGRPVAVNPQKQLAQVASARGWPAHRFPGRGRPGLVRLARNTAAYAGMATGFSTGVGLALLNRSRRSGAELGMAMGSELALAFAGVRLDVQGAEHLWSQRPAVYIINHQSPIDPFVVGKILRGEFAGVVKKQVANIPVAGQFLRFANAAFIDRGNTAQAKAVLQPAVDRLKAGISLAIAPEGTRSHTPRLGRFKKGAFHVAMQAGVPIVPIVIRNAGELMSRNAMTMRSGTIDVVVHPPIPVDGWKVEELDERIAEVRQLFLDTLEHWPGTPDVTFDGRPKAAARRRTKATVADGH